jgi:hypothetical protein
MTLNVTTHAPRRALSIAAGLAVATLMGAAPSAATPPRAAAVAQVPVPLSGVVRDAEGRPLPGATVAVGDIEARTDAAGP